MRKHGRLHLFLFLFCSILVWPQNKNQNTSIVGIWQEGSDQVAAALTNIYRFYSDNTFVFKVSGFDYLSKLYSFNGTHRISNNKLILNIKKVKEISGGELHVFNGVEYNMEYSGYKIVERNYTGKSEVEAPIEEIFENNELKVLVINYREFYKLSNDPDSLK